MKATSSLAVCALLLGSIPALAQQPPASAVAPQPVERVQVIFGDAENFTDFRDSEFPTSSGVEHLMTEFRTHITRVATPLLSEGQRLELRFVDIDLAGDFEPWRGPNFHDVRIVKEIYAPRATVEYRLLNADGTVAKEARRELSNLGFMMSTTTFANDPLRHDKDLLSDWLRREFRQPQRT